MLTRYLITSIHEHSTEPIDMIIEAHVDTTLSTLSTTLSTSSTTLSDHVQMKKTKETFSIYLNIVHQKQMYQLFCMLIINPFHTIKNRYKHG